MKQSKALTVAGWVLTALVGAMLLFSGVMKLFKPEPVVETFDHLGYPSSTIVPIAIAEIACAVVFLIPRTAPLGAILLTGYLGGAVASHVRVEEFFLWPAITAVVAWIGLYLRMPRLRALVSMLKPLSGTN